MNIERIESACRQLLLAIGEDPGRDGLKDTPTRWARWWSEFISKDKPGAWSTFPVSLNGQDIVTLSGIEEFSVCEHHLLPYRFSASLGYIPSGVVLGLSKFSRIVRQSAGRLSIQENLTQQILEDIKQATGSEDVIVKLSGVHSCMEMRGTRCPAVTTTFSASGKFLKNKYRKTFMDAVASK